MTTDLLTEPERAVSDFNARIDVGDPVTYWPIAGRRGTPKKTRLRSAAFVLDCGDPVCFVANVSGCVHILHVEFRNE